MYFANKEYPFVITASPVFIGASLSHAFCSLSAPAAAKIAPQTPPPALSSVLAAFTIASTFIFVISLRRTLKGMYYYSSLIFIS
jgi:hypothetical protein